MSQCVSGAIIYQPIVFCGDVLWLLVEDTTYVSQVIWKQNVAHQFCGGRRKQVISLRQRYVNVWKKTTQVGNIHQPRECPSVNKYNCVSVNTDQPRHVKDWVYLNVFKNKYEYAGIIIEDVSDSYRHYHWVLIWIKAPCRAIQLYQQLSQCRFHQ